MNIGDRMTEKFNATIDNDCYTPSYKYWKVTIETNNLNVLNNICSALNLIKNKESKND